MTGLLHYVRRTVSRRRVRSALTVLGVASGMLLFCFIEGLQGGVKQATEESKTGNMLVVYQWNRFCPATSNLPERYGERIKRIPGVSSVLPVRIYVNNCRASLDSVTFRGVPPELVPSADRPIRMLAGSAEALRERSDAALVGDRLARRRGLKPGDRFQIGGLSVGVAGIFVSEIPGEDNTVLVPLAHVQRSYGGQWRGRVTQFEVTIDNPKDADEIIRRIDDEFRADEAPTTTKSHKAFMTAATGDMLSIISFTRYLGLVCVGMVLALTANTVFVMARERVKEHAVLQTLGFSGPWVFAIVVAESLLLAGLGGAAGTLFAAAALHFGNLGFGAEGVQVSFLLGPDVIAAGLAVSLATGFLAGVVPAVQAAVAPITDSLRRA